MKRYTGPEHTGDQQCAICSCWGATHYKDVGNAGITQFVWLCDECAERHSETPKNGPYVIQFKDGTYNTGHGHPCQKWEADEYVSYIDAAKVANELTHEPAIKRKNQLADVELYDADPNCDHEEDLTCYNGVKCKKCGGWFCY